MKLIYGRICRLIKHGFLLLVGTMLWACLDIPSDPDTNKKISSVSIVIKQNGVEDSTLQKINSSSKATIYAYVHPNYDDESLNYIWLNGGEVIGKGDSYEVNIKENPFVPDSLVIKDQQGNKISRSIRIIVNAPPKISSKTIPADGDTIVADSHTPIHFQWNSSDPDYIDNLNHTLEIDDIKYELGNISSIDQSGFRKGVHYFRVIVSDAYGDKDSTSTRSFFIKEPKGDKP